MRLRVGVVALLLAAGPAGAWSHQGHMASGLAAWDRLFARDPAAAQAAARILAALPDPGGRPVPAIADPVPGRALFARAARWPDDVAGTAQDRPDWHYQVKVVSGATLMPLAFGGARDAFLTNLAIARDPGAAPQARAIALAWAIHIAGDMHQPLHAGHRLSWRFPLSDRAGSLAWVRVGGTMPAITLHQYWDRAADRPGDAVAGAEALAGVLDAGPAAEATPVDPAAAFDRWTAESRRAAARAYAGPALDATRDPATAPALGSAYALAARGVAEARLTLASARIAGMLVGLR